MTTITYSSDADVIAYDAHASELLFDGTEGRYNDSGSFERHRIVAKGLIDTDLDQREPSAYGIIGDAQFKTVEVYYVLAMAYRENASVAGERDRFWSLAVEYQRLYEKSIENVKAPVSSEESGEEEADEVYGNSIQFERS